MEDLLTHFLAGDLTNSPPCERLENRDSTRRRVIRTYQSRTIVETRGGADQETGTPLLERNTEILFIFLSIFCM